jgi:hypothetical protein
MGANKSLFELMAQQQVESQNYFLTKKEIELNAKKFASGLIEAGEIDKYEAFTQVVRLSNALEIIKDEIKSHLPKEKHIAFGIEMTPMSGRTMIQFQDDEMWSQLKHKLSQREELLKIALKSDEPIYDSEGVEVPKVSVKFASDSLAVKY